MRRREEKRREFHEALLQTLYPPSLSLSPPSLSLSPPSLSLSPPSLSLSPPSSPSPVEVIDEEPFDVTLINPEDYVTIGSSKNVEDNEIGDQSVIAEKPSRAQRKRLRKKMLKEEAARRKKLIGPLLPIEILHTRDGDAGGSNVEEDSDGDEEEAGGSNICSQPVRPNAQSNNEEKVGDNDKTRKVRKRREAKKLAKESSKNSESNLKSS